MGFLQILRAFPSPPEKFPRTLRVYLPDAYFRDEGRRFGVLYMQDGQNVFAHPESARLETWGANETIERLAGSRAIEPWIIVGVDHAEGRFEDYSPWVEPKVHAGGRAEVYAEFLIEHLKPFIDATYRTRTEREWTAVAGSSLGGLITLWLGLKHPDVYGRVGAFSPTVMWAGRRMFRAWNKHGPLPQLIYLDVGANERFDVDNVHLDYGGQVRAFAEQLQHLGYDHDELRVVLEPGGQHSEVDWRRRLPGALTWLLR